MNYGFVKCYSKCSKEKSCFAFFLDYLMPSPALSFYFTCCSHKCQLSPKGQIYNFVTDIHWNAKPSSSSISEVLNKSVCGFYRITYKV